MEADFWRAGEFGVFSQRSLYCWILDQSWGKWLSYLRLSLGTMLQCWDTIQYMHGLQEVVCPWEGDKADQTRAAVVSRNYFFSLGWWQEDGVEFQKTWNLCGILCVYGELGVCDHFFQGRGWRYYIYQPLQRTWGVNTSNCLKVVLELKADLEVKPMALGFSDASVKLVRREVEISGSWSYCSSNDFYLPGKVGSWLESGPGSWKCCGGWFELSVAASNQREMGMGVP